MMFTASRALRAVLMLGATALVTMTGAASAETIALVHGRILPVSSAPIEDGSVVIRDGVIVAVGKEVVIPSDARVLDIRGATVTPGFIAADTTLGIVEVSSDDGSNDVRASATTLSAGVDVQYAINPDVTTIPVARLGGVTRAIVLPEAGRSGGERLFGGQGAVISLASDGAVLTLSKIGVVAELGEAGAERGGGSRESANVLIRAALDEVRRYKAQGGRYTGEFQPVALSRPDLDALVPVIAGRVPLIIGAHRAADILQAVALAKDYRLKLVIRGGEEAWRVAPQLAKVGAGVIVVPTDNLPKSFETLGATIQNAQRLTAAGVPVAIIGNDAAHRVREMRFNAGMAVARGLPYADAIKALTLNPARMFGLDARLGSIERGKVADLVVWQGDPFEPLVQPRAIFIGGVEQPLDSRQRDLAQRYKAAR
jgi:imidazolonepropionase-like amidohydrolase